MPRQGGTACGILDLEMPEVRLGAAPVHRRRLIADSLPARPLTNRRRGVGVSGARADRVVAMQLEEQERRMRAVIKGPKEFRDLREDLPKAKK